jgi:replication-associated recombination protein RarA
VFVEKHTFKVCKMGTAKNNLYEWFSAMQKCIRRAETTDAGYWFFVLCEKGYYKQAISRLIITAHEDIGILDWDRVHFALRCIDDANRYYDMKNDAWRMMVSNAIIIMCESKKTRMGNHFQAVCRGRYYTDVKNNTIPDVPDIALCMHTSRGRSRGRGMEHFLKEGAKLVPEYTGDPWQAEAEKFWLSGILDEPKRSDTKKTSNTLF